MTQNYWKQTLEHRFTRRRALGVAATGTLGAAFLAACGGGGSEDKTDRASLVVKPVDTAKMAKRGGSLVVPATADTPGFDPYLPNAALATLQNPVMAHLLQYKPGVMEQTAYEPMPDIAESFEFAPDGLSMTLKLRQNMKWHNLPPVNGRVIDVDDITKSWDRFAQLASYRADIANSVNPNAPVLGITSTDARTLVIKLKEPISYLPAMLAANSNGALKMLPKEADSTFNFRNGMIGAGPYMMTEYKPSQSFSFKRHPDYYDKTRPYIDMIERPIMPEYATAIAQLKAGNMLTFSTGAAERVRQEDVVPLKRETPDLNLSLIHI